MSDPTVGGQVGRAIGERRSSVPASQIRVDLLRGRLPSRQGGPVVGENRLEGQIVETRSGHPSPVFERPVVTAPPGAVVVQQEFPDAMAGLGAVDNNIDRTRHESRTPLVDLKAGRDVAMTRGPASEHQAFADEAISRAGQEVTPVARLPARSAGTTTRPPDRRS